MNSFGYRSRIKRLMTTASRNSPMAEKQRQAIAEFVRARYRELHPGDTDLDAVRFVRVIYPVGDELTQADGHWEVPPLGEVPQRRRRIVATHYFDGRRSTYRR